MTYCSKCGKKNKDVADFCYSCGSKIWLPDNDSFEKRVEEYAEELGRLAERFGKKAEHVAKRIYDDVSGNNKPEDKKIKDSGKSKRKKIKQDGKYCVKCGAKYLGKPTYCSNCGKKI